MNPFREIGEQVGYKLSYIDENHIKIEDILLYKVGFEEAVYHYLYSKLLDSDVNDFSLYKSKLFLPEAYTIDSVVANGILSEDKINEIVLNNVYGQDRIEYCNKVSEILGMDEFVPENMFRYSEEDVIDYKRDDDKKLEELKSEILTYYE